MTIHNDLLIPLASQHLRDAATTLLCVTGKDPADPSTEGHVTAAEELVTKVLAVLGAARHEPIETTIARVTGQLTDAAQQLAKPQTCDHHSAALPPLSLVQQENDEQE